MSCQYNLRSPSQKNTESRKLIASAEMKQTEMKCPLPSSAKLIGPN